MIREDKGRVITVPTSTKDSNFLRKPQKQNKPRKSKHKFNEIFPFEFNPHTFHEETAQTVYEKHHVSQETQQGHNPFLPQNQSH